MLWHTINTAYLDKFYDIFVDAQAFHEDMKEEILTLQECNIWFGEYTDFIKYNIIPLWNIERISFSSNNFMAPCIDGKYYEHEFVLDGPNQIDGCLTQTNEDILEIQHEKSRILIKSEKAGSFLGLC